MPKNTIYSGSLVANEILIFKKSQTNKAKYLLEKASGPMSVIPLPVEKRSGNEYIEFLENIQKQSLHSNRRFNYGFYLGYIDGKHKRLTGVNIDDVNEKEFVCVGDTISLHRKDALLFHFYKQKLIVYVFYGQAGDLPLILSQYENDNSIYCSGLSTEI